MSLRFNKHGGVLGYDNDELSRGWGYWVAKTGRPKSGEVREKRVKISPEITLSEKKKLDWLVAALKTSMTALIVQWIEASFEAHGSIQAGVTATTPHPAPNDKAVAFIRTLASGGKPSAFDVQLLADELGIPSESLAAIVAGCCCSNQERERSENHQLCDR